jgi:tellurite resistance protein TerC
VKLSLHWAHTVWPDVPTIPTVASLFVIVGILALTTVTSLLATRGQSSDESEKELV